MYLPEHFNQKDLTAITELVKQYAFASLISSSDQADNRWPLMSFVPLLLQTNENNQPVKLLGHLAKANPHVQHLQNQAAVTAIFHGPHAYISPDWYENGGVPTWNYANVMLHGTIRFFDDSDKKQQLVDDLSEIYERPRDTPWIPDYPMAMLDAIIGFEITVEHMDAKFKLSQNKSPQDQQNVISELDALPDQLGQYVADLMQKNLNSK